MKDVCNADQMGWVNCNITCNHCRLSRNLQPANTLKFFVSHRQCHSLVLRVFVMHCCCGKIGFSRTASVGSEGKQFVYFRSTRNRQIADEHCRKISLQPPCIYRLTAFEYHLIKRFDRLKTTLHPDRMPMEQRQALCVAAVILKTTGQTGKG